MSRFLLFLSIAAFTLSGCDAICIGDGCDQTFASLFEEGITAEATPNRAAYDQPITIRATVIPAFNGTGAFTLTHIAGGRTADVLTPIPGMIGPDGVHVYRVEFEAGVPEVVEWTVQLGPRDGYVDGHGFPIAVYADSVEVRESLLPVESGEVEEAFLNGQGGLTTSAANYPSLVLQ